MVVLLCAKVSDIPPALVPGSLLSSPTVVPLSPPVLPVPEPGNKILELDGAVSGAAVIEVNILVGMIGEGRSCAIDVSSDGLGTNPGRAVEAIRGIEIGFVTAGAVEIIDFVSIVLASADDIPENKEDAAVGYTPVDKNGDEDVTDPKPMGLRRTCQWSNCNGQEWCRSWPNSSTHERPRGLNGNR